MKLSYGGTHSLRLKPFNDTVEVVTVAWLLCESYEVKFTKQKVSDDFFHFPYQQLIDFHDLDRCRALTLKMQMIF